MSRWIYLILPIVSAGLLAAALSSSPAPAVYRIGCVDPDRLFKRQPDHQSLEQIRSVTRKTLLLREMIPSRYGADGFPDRVADAEWRFAAAGFEMRSRRLVDLWSESLFGNLETDYLALIETCADEDGKLFKETDRQLMEIYSRLAENETEDGLKEERFRLMNLRLKIQVLTHDPFVFSDERFKEIQDEIAAIEKTISDAEELHLKQIQESFRQESEVIREQYRRESEERERKLAEKADQMLRDTESLLEMILMSHRQEIDRRIGDAGKTRRLMFSGGSGIVSARVFSDNTDNSRILDAIESELRTEFDRRLRRKAPAVAERRRLSAILVCLHPVGADSVEVTADF